MNIDVFVQNIKKYCELRGVKPTAACRDSGAGKSLISQIETRGVIPSVEKVQLLAGYLGVSTSELLGEPARASPSLDAPAPGENVPETDPLRLALLRNFDRLNQEGRERLVETSDDMVSSGKYIKTGSIQLGSEKFA